MKVIIFAVIMSLLLGQTAAFAAEQPTGETVSQKSSVLILKQGMLPSDMLWLAIKNTKSVPHTFTINGVQQLSAIADMGDEGSDSLFTFSHVLADASLLTDKNYYFDVNQRTVAYINGMELPEESNYSLMLRNDNLVDITQRSTWGDEEAMGLTMDNSDLNLIYGVYSLGLKAGTTKYATTVTKDGKKYYAVSLTMREKALRAAMEKYMEEPIELINEMDWVSLYVTFWIESESMQIVQAACDLAFQATEDYSRLTNYLKAQVRFFYE